jgi:hypothetical protein
VTEDNPEGQGIGEQDTTKSQTNDEIVDYDSHEKMAEKKRGTKNRRIGDD